MTATFTKSDIFTSAWIKAREMATIAGTGPRAQFAAALRATYQTLRDHAAAEAADRAARIEALHEELEEMTSVSFGTRASDAKAQHVARTAALRAQITALAA